MVRKPQCSCPHAQGLFALLGKKWVIFILQAIDSGATSYTDIRKSIGEANTKILTDRLYELTTVGIVTKTANGKYQLTHTGQSLTHQLIELSKWWGQHENYLR